MQSNITPNRLVIHVQPDEGITLDIHAKRPGPYIYIANVPLDFSYADFGEHTAATGYETLLYDCAIGDPDAVSPLRQRRCVLENCEPDFGCARLCRRAIFRTIRRGVGDRRRRTISLKRQATNGITITSTARLGARW